MMWRIVGAIGLILVLSGCSGFGILNQTSTTEQQLEIMKAQNARGCIYFGGSAAPWAQVKTVIVGTWGADPPPYAECFKTLPVGIP